MTVKAWVESEKSKKNRKNLMIVDTMNIARRVPKSIKDEKAFYAALVNELSNFGRKFSAKTTILVSDKGVSAYRRSILPEYKDNREQARKAKSEAEQRADYEWFLKMKGGIELLKNDMKVFTYQDVEGDDLAACIVGYAKELTDTYDHIWLISSDGDWDTLLDDNVSRYSFYTNKEYHVHNMYDQCGADNPEQFAQLKAIMGDRGDNVMGIDGVGKKTGYNLLRQYGNLFNIVDSLPLPDVHKKYIQKVNASGDLLLRNLQLVDLVSFAPEALNYVGVYDEFMSEIKKLLV